MASHRVAQFSEAVALGQATTWARKLSGQFRHVVLFYVNGAEAQPLAVHGMDAASPPTVSLVRQTPLRWCVEAASPIIGAGRSPGGASVAEAFGHDAPRGYAVLPFVSHGQLLALIYLDNGGDPLPVNAVASLVGEQEVPPQAGQTASPTARPRRRRERGPRAPGRRSNLSLAPVLRPIEGLTVAPNTDAHEQARMQAEAGAQADRNEGDYVVGEGFDPPDPDALTPLEQALRDASEQSSRRVRALPAVVPDAKAHPSSQAGPASALLDEEEDDPEHPSPVRRVARAIQNAMARANTRAPQRGATVLQRRASDDEKARQDAQKQPPLRRDDARDVGADEQAREDAYQAEEAEARRLLRESALRRAQVVAAQQAAREQEHRTRQDKEHTLQARRQEERARRDELAAEQRARDEAIRAERRAYEERQLAEALALEADELAREEKRKADAEACARAALAEAEALARQRASALEALARQREAEAEARAQARMRAACEREQKRAQQREAAALAQQEKQRAKQRTNERAKEERLRTHGFRQGHFSRHARAPADTDSLPLPETRNTARPTYEGHAASTLLAAASEVYPWSVLDAPLFEEAPKLGRAPDLHSTAEACDAGALAQDAQAPGFVSAPNVGHDAGAEAALSNEACQDFAHLTQASGGGACVTTAKPARLGMARKLVLALAVLLPLSAIATLIALCAPPPREQSVELEVIDADNVATIGRALSQAHVIQSAPMLSLMARFSGLDRQLRAGTYIIPPNLWAWEVLQVLHRGQVQTVRVTLPEGLTLTETANVWSQHGLARQEEFVAAASDPQLLRKYGIEGNNAEGFLYPETYNVARGLSARSLVETQVRAFFDHVGRIPQAISLSPQELYDRVIVASLVEREARDPAERPRIAGVFYNRLNRDMRLESCATVQYLLGKPKERLTIDDVRIASPYNTYLHPGLPPGPIANPGKAAFEAALLPEGNDFLFFFAKEDGSHNHHFSRTYGEHQRAHRQMQRAL